jgi:sugar lactone lactonase YvrE
MKTMLIGSVAAAALVVAMSSAPVSAWDRGKVETFAILPEGSTGPEGLTVGLDGNIYVTTFGFNAVGAVSGPGQLFVFAPNGTLLRHVAVSGSTSHLLGLAFNPKTHDLIVLDFGAGLATGTAKALKVNPITGASTLFSAIPTMFGTPGINALTFDTDGNVYISDSFQGVIWKTGQAGGAPTVWAHDPLLATTGVPPFGANGIEFNNERDAMFVANTGDDRLIRIEVNPDGTAGAVKVFTNSVNGADGIVIDRDDHIWVAANQADEIVVVDTTGKVIAKLGDFNGVDDDGVPQGLLFPASPDFSKDGKFLYVTNLALDLRLAGSELAVDSAWADLVEHYTISRIRARIPTQPDED